MVRVIRVAGALLAAALLAGCGGSGPTFLPAPPYQCFASVSMQWIEPGLFDALPAGAARAGFSLLADGGPVSVLAVDHPTVRARWDHARLQMAAMEDGEGGQMRITPWTPGEWMVDSTVTWDNETLLRHARAFFDALKLGAHPERPAWERALVASRHQGPYPVAYIVAQPELAPLLDALGEPAPGPAGVGTATLEWEAWRVVLEIGTRHIVAPTEVNDAFDLVVDETDNVSAYTDVHAGMLAFPTLQARANATFERMGLPPPTFAGVRGSGGSGC